MSVLEWSGALLPWRDDLDDLKERIGRLFRRPEPRRQIGLYLDGLIGEVDKKNGWQLAEYAAWRNQGQRHRVSDDGSQYARRGLPARVGIRAVMPASVSDLRALRSYSPSGIPP